MAQNSDLFGSFLSGPVASVTPDAAPAAAAPVAETSGPLTSDGLLHMLAMSDAPVSLKTLVSDTPGSVTEVLKLLGDMESLRLVKRTGDGASATFLITPFGRELAPPQPPAA